MGVWGSVSGCTRAHVHACLTFFYHFLTVCDSVHSLCFSRALCNYMSASITYMCSLLSFSLSCSGECSAMCDQQYRCIFCGHGTYSPVSKVPYKYLSILLTSNPVSTSLSFLPASSRGGRSGETLLGGQMMWRVVPLASAQQAFSPAHHLSGCLSICRWSGRCWFLVLLINPDFCLLPLSLQVLPWAFWLSMLPLKVDFVLLSSLERPGQGHRSILCCFSPVMVWIRCPSSLRVLEVWPCWRKRVTVGVGFQVFFLRLHLCDSQ